MKKYTYYFKNMDLKIEADNGTEAEAEFMRVTGKTTPEYEGIIELIDNSGRIQNRMMYPIKFAN